MPPVHAASLASELLEAYDQRRLVPPPSTREGGLDLPTAYATEAEIVRRRAAAGHRPVGLKVGFANKAAWRLLKLETLVWAHMYDDTVQRAVADQAELPVERLVAPKIEPEIVFSVKRTPAGGTDAAGVLEAVDWIALGFEIIDCVYPDWQFQPMDFVAARGLHAALVVGSPLAITDDNRAQVAEALPSFTIRLEKNGETVATGGGRNVLRSPALCLGELAAALQRQDLRPPLQPGELVSSGTLTESQPLGPGETWMAQAEGLPVSVLTLRTTGGESGSGF
jgi:2-oxo-3-hexenedioate decarboxylase